MSATCWKCSREIPDDVAGVKCPACSGEAVYAVPARTEIDWSKVTRFEDLRLIMETIGMTVNIGSEAHRKLGRFCKEPPST